MGDSSMVDPHACVLVGAISTSDETHVRARALDAFGDFNSTHVLYIITRNDRGRYEMCSRLIHRIAIDVEGSPTNARSLSH